MAYYQTARGNIKDTGIQAEAEEMVRRGAAGDVCEALGKMLDAAEATRGAKRQERIVRTKAMTAGTIDRSADLYANPLLSG